MPKFVPFEIYVDDPDRKEFDISKQAKPSLAKITTDGNIHIKFNNEVVYRKPIGRRLQEQLKYTTIEEETECDWLME
jgi:hypothetical protein